MTTAAYLSIDSGAAALLGTTNITGGGVTFYDWFIAVIGKPIGKASTR